MKNRAFLRKAFVVIMAAVLPIALLSGCETTQSGGGAVGGVLGAVAGSVLPVPADSLVRAGTAIGKTFQDITPEQEYYIGRTVAANILAKYPVYANDDATMYLNVLGQTLAQVSDRPETFGGYHFLILDSPEINAFAAPGGFILVTRGMIHLCKTEDALAAVLAHEIGHIQGQHGLRAIKTGRLTTAFNILAMEAAKSYGPSQLAQLTEAFEGSITDITSTLMNNGYSRDLEFEADQSALTILKRVGYAQGALTVMLAEMKMQLKPGGAGFASTHPEPADRIQKIGAASGKTQAISCPAPRQQRFQTVMGGV
ncbi:MAG: M48 family metallopeptidase [Syntrophobacteraceae bacterium]|nr:M48 family metallopeptidase [Desulfobacteraceae bacterium]